MFDKRAAVSCKCQSLVVVLWCCWATHRCALMHSGIKAKRQPFCGWCFLEIMCLGRGQRQMFSVTFCQMLELRIRTLLLDWKRGSEALSRHHSYHRGFEVHFSLRATAFSINPSFFCCRDLKCCPQIEVRVVPLLCAVQPGRCRFTRASSSP